VRLKRGRGWNGGQEGGKKKIYMDNRLSDLAVEEE
jgi:hypothetical protein